MDVVARVMMLRFMYEDSDPVMMFNYYVESMYNYVGTLFLFALISFAVFFWIYHWLSSHFWIFLIAVALHWETK